jgi:hypothetical protein
MIRRSESSLPITSDNGLLRHSRRLLCALYIVLWGLICFGAIVVRFLIGKIAIFGMISLRRLIQWRGGTNSKSDST